LGQHGVNIVEFTKAFNAQTAHENGRIIRWRSRFTTAVHLHHEDAGCRLIKEAPIESARLPNRPRWPLTQARLIAETKMPDQRTTGGAMLVIAGTAR
jgi:large subunit ribosomal protein L11